MDIKKLIKTSNYAHKAMTIDEKDSAEYRFLHKKVYCKKNLFNGERLEQAKLVGTGILEESSEFKDHGKKTIKLTVNPQIENIIPRPSCTISIDALGVDLSKYNRLSLWIYPRSVGYVNFYFHISINNQGIIQKHAPSLTPNMWNHVTWELTKATRNHVDRIDINPFLMGCPPEATPLLEVFVGNIDAELVDAEDDEGWDLNNRLAYSHVGYYQDYQKQVIAQNLSDLSFKLLNKRHEVVYEGIAQQIHTNFGAYYEMDFSDFKICGEYYLIVDDKKTALFPICANPYLSATWKSMNFLRMLRCGEEVETVHSACHLNCRSVHPDGRSVPNFGGWHDAGDVSQFEICTAEMANAILDLAEKYEKSDPILSERLLEEAKVGVTWLLRTRFNDGMRALAITYSIWRDNVLSPDNKTVYNNVAENGPFENFCACAAEAVAARLFAQKDPVYSDWCKRVAISDYEFAKKGYQDGIYTKRWGPNIDSQVCGAGALCAAELFKLTSDNKYLDDGSFYADIILSCQQKEMPKWDKPLRGFFYEDPNHTKTLTYEHRGHEQSPIQGLARLMEVAPDHPNYQHWKQGLVLYAEYIKATEKMAAPYNLLPAHVYELDKINMERFTVPVSYGTKEEALVNLKLQAQQGIRLAENVYLRIFPIAIQRRGYHATLLSKVKAVSMIAKVLNDNELYQIVINQLEWIFGKNPFASSTMYGEGHNYHNLYVAFSPQLVGALPVGIKTYLEHDAPYWPTLDDAVFKEIWGHTTGKFLWILADLK